MKNNSIVFFLLVSFFCFSQINNGVVTYGVVKNDIEKYTDSEYLIQMDKEAKEIASSIVLNISFNKQEIGYKVKEIALPKDKSTDDYTFSLDFEEKIYENRKKKIYRKYFSSPRIGDVVKIDTLQYKWTITKETKEINSYICYKATTLRYGDKGPLDEKHSITAWFTPKIPVPYGPNGYGKLPGLILELQSYRSTIFVKTIDLNLKQDPEIDTLENYPQLTGDEILEYMMSSMTPEQKKAVLDSKRINEK